MPGFGSGPFGHQPFGEWKWSRRVLFEYVPELYKQLDADSGGFLELFSESLRPSFDNLRQKVRDMLETRDPLLVRTQYDQVKRLRLGPALGLKGAIEQSGVTGSVDAVQQFNAPTARFRVNDVGKELYVSGSQFPQNNRKVTLVRVLSNTSIITDPLLAVDAGPLRWELRTKVDPPTDRLTVEVRSGDISEMTPGWLLFDGFADFTILTRRQFKVPVDERQHLTEQNGTDGAIDSSGRFMAATAVLDQLDVGKHITIVGSTITDNNGKAEITKIVEVAPGDIRAELDADPPFVEDANLTWAILPHGEIEISGTVPPKGVVEQEGVDLTITASGVSDATVVAPSGSFTDNDIGKELSLRGSTAVPSNDGVYEVTEILTSTSFKVVQRTPIPLVVETLNNLTWELRTATSLGDLTQVDARAPSMITSFAPDFGIEIDTQESEDRQRSWVKNVTQWIDLKGTHDGYRIIGAISGFEVTTFQLFRVAPALFDVIPDDHEYEIGEAGAGRSGTDATITQTLSLRYRLTAPSAAFVATDVGRQIRIRNAATIANNELLTIDSIVNSTTVEFSIGDTFSLPEPNNGALTWTIVRLYTDLAPLLPLYDEVNNDLLEEIVDTTSGGFLFYEVDRYCWEDNFDTTVHIDVQSVTTVSPGVHRISVTGSDAFIVAPEVVLKVGRWQFVSLAVALTDSGDTLSASPPDVSLTDATGAFTASMVGKWIRISGATTASNNGTFVITDVASATTLTFFNGLGVGEPFTGTYEILDETDYFVDTVPVLTTTLVNIVAINVGDSFSKVGDVITLTDSSMPFLASVVGKHIVITGATTAGNNGIFLITAWLSSTQIQYKNANGVTEAYTGTWSIGTGVYTFLISAAVPPTASGPAKLRYVCAPVLSCDYCAASKVFALVEPTAELLAEGGSAVERLLERVVARMEDVTPAHVELIIRYRQSITATLSTLTATVETEVIDSALFAPLTAFYDEIPADDLTADTVLVATIEPTIT